LYSRLEKEIVKDKTKTLQIFNIAVIKPTTHKNILTIIDFLSGDHDALRGLYHKTFYIRDQFRTVKSLSACHFQACLIFTDKGAAYPNGNLTGHYSTSSLNGEESIAAILIWALIQRWILRTGNTKGGRITVLLTSCLTGLESAV